METARADGRMYHPVLSGHKFFQKTLRHLASAEEESTLRGFIMFSPEFFKELAVECGGESAENIRQKVQRDLQRLGFSFRKLNLLIAQVRLGMILPRWLVKMAKAFIAVSRKIAGRPDRNITASAE